MYRAPLKDIGFTLDHVAPLADLSALEAFAHAGREVVAELLEEAGRFAAEAVAPTNRDGDVAPARLAPDGEVVLPPSFHRVYEQYVAAGWGALGHPAAFGGGGFPLLVATAVKELLTSANMALSLCPMLTAGAVCLLERHGSPDQQATYLPHLVSGRWSGTMDITEPQAGSDVGAVATRAVPHADGSYRVRGQKIFITFGEHRLTENIVHLVLARLPGAPDGTRGLSLFVVPKFLVGPDGSLGARNDVYALSVEHKLGIHGSPTCVMAFGERADGAVGTLVGEPNQGIRQMFTMMNDARLGIGVQGLAVAERAYQAAMAYARERRQGARPAGPPGEQAPIVEHADVRRMLMTQKACIEAMRAVCYANARALDLARAAREPEDRAYYGRVADLLTPLSKAWSTDLGVELTSLALQVHGGTGYVEEAGAAQHYRDARIAPIYEGTNGIQALDLVGRKLRMQDGRFVRGYLAGARAEVAALPPALDCLRERVGEGLDALDRATEWMLGARERDAAAGAAPYLRLFGTVTGAWLLSRGAAAATTLPRERPEDVAFLEGKIATASFFAEQVLPQAHGLAAAATAGAAGLDAFASTQLA